MYFNDEQLRFIEELIDEGGRVVIRCSQANLKESGCGDYFTIFAEEINYNNINNLIKITRRNAVNYLQECYDVAKTNAKDFTKYKGGYVNTILEVDLYNNNDELIQNDAFGWNSIIDEDNYYYN